MIHLTNVVYFKKFHCFVHDLNSSRWVQEGHLIFKDFLMAWSEEHHLPNSSDESLVSLLPKIKASNSTYLSF